MDVLTELFSAKFSPKQLAKALGVRVYTLEYWRHRKNGPPYHREGRRIYYYLDELKAWREKTKWS